MVLRNGEWVIVVPTSSSSNLDKGSPFTLDYDKLIISVGSYSNTFGIPGVKEHGFFLKDIQDARRIRARVLECKFAPRKIRF